MYVCSTCDSRSEKEAGMCHEGARMPACAMCGFARSRCQCWCWVLGKAAIALGAAAAVAAWVTNAYGTRWMGMDSDALFHSAIVLLLGGMLCARKNRCGGNGTCS